MKHARLITVTGIIFTAAIMRLIPHPPNVTPISAMALFGGAVLASRMQAYAIPIIAMILSDLMLAVLLYGSYAFALAPFTYTGFLVIVLLGRLIRNRPGFANLQTTMIGGTLLYFVITNLGVWLFYGRYAHTPAGLLTCYTAAIPFLRNALIGNAVFTAIIFGGFHLLETHVSVLRSRRPVCA